MSNGEGYPSTLAILNALTCAINAPYFAGMTDRLHKWRDDEIPKLSTTSDRKRLNTGGRPVNETAP
jgi:hypothetical protein